MPIELVKRHNSRCWYMRGTERGIAVDESTRTDNREAAEAILTRKRNEILDRSIFGAKATVTFLQAAVTYMDQGGEARFIQPLIDHFKGRKLSTIGQDDIDAAARAIYPGASNATWNRQIYTPVSAVLKKAAKRGWCDFAVLERPRQPSGKVRWLSVPEAQRLVDCASPHLQPLLIFLFGTGARLSEALYLQWSHVDLKAGQVFFDETKSEVARGVPLSPRVVATLASLGHRVGPVFLTNKGVPYRFKDDGGGQIKTAFAGACRRAGIADFTTHDCRHTFATWHYSKHRDLAQLMAVCGWKSVEMAMRYAHVNVEHMAANMNAIGW